MAVFALHIVKQAEFEGQQREFGNTYHYRTNTGEAFDDQSVAEYVAEAERLVTGAYVEFLRWTTWGPTDGPTIDNVMREAGELAGFGSVALIEGLMKEYGPLVVWPMERAPVTNRRRWLRKFLRSAPGASLNAEQRSGRDPLTVTQLGPLETYASTVRDAPNGAGGFYPLTNAAGDGSSAPGFARPFMTTREIASAH